VAAGEHFLNQQLDTPKAMLFFDKALEFSKMCPHNTEQQIVLISIAMLKYRAGEYLTAQAHVAEAQQLLKLAPNLFQEARALWIGAMCSTSLGNFQWSIDRLHRARAVLGICGLERGFMYQTITIAQAEIHLVKSEYAQARSIYSQIVENNSPEQNAFSYAISLLNIAQINTICGDVGDVYHKLNLAKNIFSTSLFPRESIFCSMLTADIELREEKFDLEKLRFQDCLHSMGRTDNEIESFCLDRLADIRAWPISAWQSRWPVIYCVHAYKSNNTLALHKALLGLGDVFSTNKEDAVAMNLYLVALQGFTYMDVHHSRAQCMIRLGDLANKRGHTLNSN
jgi:tetratricopeptide (TPR) repeat protein